MNHNTINFQIKAGGMYVLLFISLALSCQNPKSQKQTNDQSPSDTIQTIIRTNFNASDDEGDTTGWGDFSPLLEKDTLSTDSLARLHKRYAHTKTRIKQRRYQLAEQYNLASSDSAKKEILAQASKYLELELVEEIFPAWYGTSWDFNGYSNIPNVGIIACGYFVSTPLKHIGLQLNRYKLAQQYSTAIVETLCREQKTFSDLDEMLAYVQSRPDDLYIVGLTNHVGFIHKSIHGVRFIHSNYLDPVAVESEEASQSEALAYSQVFVLGALTSNQDLIKKWLTGAEIKIKT